jgi:pyruvate dehydrogenase E2 component (dihydrolipoamide acetyltransferase)
MAKEVRLPRLGQTMEKGTIVNCLINVGDEVKKGDIIFEIETDKATLEMESPEEGFVKHIFAKTDQTITVGEPLLILGGKNEIVTQSFIDSLKDTFSAQQETQKQEQVQEELIPVEMEIEQTAEEITELDVKDASEKKLVSQAIINEGEIKIGQSFRVNRLQKITAARMLKSKREIPCFYLTVKADVTNMVELRNRLNQSGEIKYSYNDFIIKAIAAGLEKFPVMTGQIEGDMIKCQETINVGLAISVPDGLVAPILKDVDKKDIRQISKESRILIEKARSNKLSPADLEGGCITVSNLGAFGIDNFIPIVVPGQCSILGIGRINDVCNPDNGSLIVRKMMNMTLSVDHKVANGAYAAQFLDYVHKLLDDVSTFNFE